MSNVIPFDRSYNAKQFSAGDWLASGTLCGCIDIATPNGTFCLTPDEAAALTRAIDLARVDVLANSSPLHDPCIFERFAK
jgi:hypothetical protein